jgi:hypothetical protein
MVKNNILTEDGRGVKILTQIKIDKNLPKYRVMAERTNGDTDKKWNNRATQMDGTVPGEREDLVKNKMSYEYLKQFMNDKTKDVTDFNVSITDQINNILKDTSAEGFVIRGSLNSGFVDNGPKPVSLWNSIKEYFRNKKKFQEEREYEEEQEKFDVIGFFSDIHDLIDDKERDKYVNRISDIIECIGVAELSGQVALKEKLIKSLVVNKLESILYAKGMYECIDENVLIELCQKAPKALRLDYIANFTRNIPIDCIRKKLEIDKLCIFDNYCVLHYDPEDTGTEKTDEEKQKEANKKKDPIIFGLINGSKKLYHICSFEDEYCDLTFDKLTEIVGKEVVESGFLNEHIK